MNACEAARARADEVLAGGLGPASARVERWFAVGDPQTSFARFVAILDHHGLIGGDGWLRAEVGLVSMGDHFDYHSTEPLDVVGREGQRILAWLAAHPRDQVRLLLGNHDAARVIEFGAFTDDRFQQLAAEIKTLAKSELPAFTQRHGVASAGLVERDYSSWNEAQRAQVQSLLLASRYELALVALVDHVPVLFTHAGVTKRELTLLNLAADSSALAVRSALQWQLHAAIEAVRADWERKFPTPLSLEPLHVSPAPGREAGGLLAHRPANPNRPGIENHAWEWDPERPRRFAIDQLPTAFDQAVGHTGRGTLERELVPWNAGLSKQPGPIHTLHFGRGEPSIEEGVGARREASARVFMLDPSMSKLADPAHARLMPLERLQPTRE